MKNPLQDKEFLYNLNQDRHKEIYAKIISLSFDEKPLEQIEGRVTSGSINIDGTSTVRRTCNLTLIAKDVNITDFYWGVSNKFTLEIGLKNNINKEYPNIIWFKQGIYVITSFNSSLTNSNYTISINGKDKMCLLNGEIGGSLPSSIDFGKIDIYEDTYSEVQIKDYTQYVANKYYIYENGEYKISLNEFNEKTKYYTKDVLLKQDSLKLKDIIKEAVHEYGKELYHNIIINDLDNYGLELLEYRGDKPLYLLYDEAAQIYTQMVIDKDFSIGNGYTISTCPQYNNAIDSLNDGRYIFTLEDGKKYSATKVEYGATAGYRTTDLTYPGDLISSVGESLTSILDKIKNTIGAFEYFYDIDGRFIFQAKKIYSQNSWNTLVNADNNIFARDAIEESPYSYSFEDVNLIQQFQNTPAINNVKNDYSIWGTRKGITGVEIPIHARYAIHNKPVYYHSYDGNTYTTLEMNNKDINYKKVDWREIIYQMALDYFKHGQEEDFLYNVQNNNLKMDGLSSYYPEGETGYEAFYTDIQGFWRQLYDPNPDIIYDTEGGYYSEEKEYEPDGVTYKIKTIWNPFKEKDTFTCDYYLKGENETDDYSATKYYWNKNVVLAPEQLNFWIDFYDGNDSLMQYSIAAIGDRPKVVNDSKITSIYFRNVPQVIFTNGQDYNGLDIKTGYTYIWLDKSMQDLFSISAQGKSAEEEMNELFNNYSYCSEGVTITAVPIYNLEPNTLVYIYNEENKINGKYQVNRITIPLNYNGMMSITATKIIEQVY